MTDWPLRFTVIEFLFKKKNCRSIFLEALIFYFYFFILPLHFSFETPISFPAVNAMFLSLKKIATLLAPFLREISILTKTKLSLLRSLHFWGKSKKKLRKKYLLARSIFSAENLLFTKLIWRGLRLQQQLSEVLNSVYSSLE